MDEAGLVCVIYAPYVTTAEPGNVQGKEILINEDINLTSVSDVVAKLIEPTNQGVQFSSSPIQACIPDHLLNPQKHKWHAFQCVLFSIYPLVSP